MRPPENLDLAPFIIAPAEMSGLGRFWAVYERLDRGAVEHVRYLGFVPAVPDETAAQLFERIRAKYAER